jgi:hypothetical protein
MDLTALCPCHMALWKVKIKSGVLVYLKELSIEAAA